MLKRKELLVIFLLLFLGLFFRLYNFNNFLFWSDDEQQQWYMLRHILVDGHPSLVMPNAALGVGLNPLYHYLLVPLYALARFNPVALQSFGILFFLLNLPVLYFTGKSLGNRKVGFIAAFLYSFSFIAALFDKRLWALSPNFLVVTLTVLALVKLLERKYRYAFLLIPALVLPFSSDPSLGILFLPIVSIIAMKVFIPKKILFLALTLAMILLSPLVFFEARHNFQNTRSLVMTLTRYQGQAMREDVANNNFLYSQLENFTRFFFARSSQTAESFFCYCFLNDKIPMLFVIGVGVSIAVFALLVIKSKDKKYFLLLIFLISYLIGKYIFQQIFKGYPAFFYSLAIAPVLFLGAAILLSKLPKITIAVVLLFFLFVNFNTLAKSTFKYPLSDRMKLAQQVKGENYALYYSGDILISGGGFTSLLDYYKGSPVSGNLELYWGHLYTSYGLYKFNTTAADTVVIISENDLQEKYPYSPLQLIKVGNLNAFIYDNSKKWFVPEIHMEKLYQPKYF